MNRLKVLAATLVLISVFTLSLAAPASAYNIFKTVCNKGGGSSAVCQGSTNKNPLVGNGGVIIGITNVVTLIAGIIAVIIIILAGLRFVQSGGSSEDVAGARRTLIYAIVGLVVIMLARALIGLVIGNL